MSAFIAYRHRVWWVFATVLFASGLGGVALASTVQPESAEIPIPSPLQSDPIQHTINTLSNQPSNEYIVVFNETVGRSAQVRRATRQSILAAGGRVNHDYSRVFNGMAITLASDEALANLADNPSVAYIEPNGMMHVTDSPQISPTWGIDRIDQVSLPADGRYAYAGDGTGVHAFIIDTGIMSTHHEFIGRIGEGYDLYNDDSDPDDDHWHGTHVAGTLGGTTYGVAKDVTLHAVKVCNASGSCPHDVILSAFEWVINRPERPAVINMSLGGFFNQATNDAIAAAVEAGIIVVVAAANSSEDACESSPGSSAEAIVVGASDSSDALASFTNYGSCVDLFAPGVSILSAYYTGVTATRTANGTSMASPHVAGAAAIYLEAGYSQTEATDALINSASSGQLTGLIGDSPDKLLYQAVQPIGLAVTPTANTSCTSGGTVDVGLDLTVSELYPFMGNVLLSTASAPGSATFATNPFTSLPSSTTLSVTGVTAGDHYFDIMATSVLTPSIVVTQTVRQHVADAVPAIPVQIAPTDVMTDVSRQPTLNWGGVAETVTYTLAVGLDAGLTNLVYSTTLTGTSQRVDHLAADTLHYWRVTAHNGCGETESATRSFTTRSSQLFVDMDALGTASGLSWTNAYTDLAAALTEAIDGDTLWVAEGTYSPASAGGDREATFLIQPGVAVYGGFIGDEMMLVHRDSDPASNNTILSGDLNGDDSGSSNLSDNSYSVVEFGLYAGSNTVLDGFTIIGGNADGEGQLAQPQTGGGGIFLSYGAPKLHNLIITQNYANKTGAGLATYGSPDVENVLFSDNIVLGNGFEEELYGGGMFSYYGEPILRDVTFRDNQVVVSGTDTIASAGGFIQVEGSTTLVDVTFDGNAITATGGITGGARTMGGGFRNLAADATLVNVLFVGNSAETTDPYSMTAEAYGGAMHSSYAYAPLTNVIFSGNHVTATSDAAATSHGGAIYNFGQMRVTNATLYRNTSSESGGAIFNGATVGGTTPTLDAINSIFWENSDTGGTDTSAQVHDTSVPSTISYSILQGGWVAAGMIDSDPLFADADGADNIVGTVDDDFRGQFNSPMLSIGSNGALPTDEADVDDDGDIDEQLPLDWAGQARIVDTQVDYGAVETQIALETVTVGSSAVLTYTGVDGSGFSAEITAGSVTETVELIFIKQDTVQGNPSGMSFGGQAFTLDTVIGGVMQSEYTFQQPITVTITYTDEGIGELDESVLFLHYYDTDSGLWVEAATSCTPTSTYSRDTASNTLTVPICHLTEFGIFGASTPTSVTMRGISAETTPPAYILTLLFILYAIMIDVTIRRSRLNNRV